MGLFTYPEFGLDKEYKPLSKKGKAEMTAISENLGIIAGSAVMCMFIVWPLSFKNHILPAINAATGLGLTLNELGAIGERGWHIQRAFSNLCGLDASHDTLPERVLNPHPEGAPTGLDNIAHQITSFKPPSSPFMRKISSGIIQRILPVQKQLVKNMGRVMFMKKLAGEELAKKGKPDLEYMLREYYTIRELDRRGFPREKKLKSLLLDDVAAALHGDAAASDQQQ